VRVQALADLYQAEIYYGMAGHRTRDVVTSLLALVEDPDASVRAGLCRNLTGAVPPDLAAALIRSLRLDSETSVREEAAGALGPLHEVPAVQEALEAASRTDSARSVRERARKSLKGE